MADLPALLTVRGLNVFYGHSHAPQGVVEFTIHSDQDVQELYLEGGHG